MQLLKKDFIAEINRHLQRQILLSDKLFQCPRQNKITLKRRIQSKATTITNKHVSPIRSMPEPTVWSCDTGQRIPWFDSCQLAITWMSYVENKQGGMPRSTYFRSMAAMLRDFVIRRAHAPANHAASHDGHDKINAWPRSGA